MHALAAHIGVHTELFRHMPVAVKGVEASAATALLGLEGLGRVVVLRVLAEVPALLVHPFCYPPHQVLQQLVLDVLMCMYRSCIDHVSLMYRKCIHHVS